jgi:hypothetical protein
MPAIGWSELNSSIDPVPTWRFYCTLPSVSNSNSLNGQKISFNVERATLPIQSLAYEPAPYNAGERKFPSVRTLDVIGISFLEDTSYSVLNYLLGWKNLVVDDSGNFGLPAIYKKQIQLDSLDVQGNVIKSFYYPYCSPTRIDSIDFDGTATKPIMINAYFEVDNVFNNNSTTNTTSSNVSVNSGSPSSPSSSSNNVVSGSNQNGNFSLEFQ